MSMDFVNFVFGTLTGVAGNAAYDGIKLIFGSTFSSLEASAKADNKEKFELILQTAIEQNNEIKQQLEQLQQGKSINIVKQDNIFGDNVAGDKVINNN